MSMDATQRHVELVADLIGQIQAHLVRPLTELLGTTAMASVGERLAIEAEMWAAQLLGRDHQLAAQTARNIVRVLYGAGDDFEPPPGWWASPFGRVVLLRIGHPSHERVSYAQAGAMLGITRQGVHDLLNRGKLQRHPDGGVAIDSVRQRSARLDPDSALLLREDAHV